MDHPEAPFCTQNDQPLESQEVLVFPASFAQERLWFLHELTPDIPLYNMVRAFACKGPLNVPALTHSITHLVNRHEILRTSFSLVEGQLKQIVESDSSSLNYLEVVDVSGAETAEIQQLITAEVHHSFDLTHPPLFRVRLLRLGENDHILLLNLHHILSDGWSMGVLFRELSELYTENTTPNALLAPHSSLSPLPIQYADFAHWQREGLQGELLETELAYWKEQLAAPLPVLDLPVTRRQPDEPGFSGGRHHFALSSALTENLKILSRREGTTLFMTLLAAFQTLLHRYTSQEDMCIGTPVTGRSRSELEPLIGFFVNTLVLRANLAGEPSFRELLQRVRQETLDALAHQDVPFEKVVEAVQPQRTHTHSPLFQVMFDFESTSEPEPIWAGVEVKRLPVEIPFAKFNLTLVFQQTADSLQGILEYNCDLFESETIKRMAEHLEILLTGIVVNPDQKLWQLPLLTAVEQQLLRDWNRTEAVYPGHDQCLHTLFEAQVERTPLETAVFYEGQTLTYQELNQRANQLAHYLQATGIGTDQLVAVCLDRSPDMIVALLGILKAGAAYVPLDPTYPVQRLAYLLEDSKAAVLLTSSHLQLTIDNSSLSICYLNTIWHTLSTFPTTNPISAVTPNDLAYVMYTSGSTGQPKGVMIPHRGIVNRILWGINHYQVTPSDNILQKTTFSFDVSVWEIFGALLAGARLVLPQPGGQQDPAYLVQLMALTHISLVDFVPSMLELVLEEPALSNCTHLRLVTSGGEALPPAVRDRFFVRLPHVVFHNCYGPTEASIDATYWVCDPNQPISIGRPHANQRIYILDKHQQPVPIGIPGELYIGGAGVALGYLNRPELTAEKFTIDDLQLTIGEETQNRKSTIVNRKYCTGDLARYRPDGNIEFLGRVDDQVKIRGYRVELGEIEAVLRQHATVQETAVLLHPTSTTPELIAYLVPANLDKPFAWEPLRDHLSRHLPAYMIPGRWVILDKLPRTPGGKLDRRVLPLPDHSETVTNSVTLPRTPLEETLAAIWSQLLARHHHDIHANFFQVGGHSLLATRVVARIRQLFQVELPLRAFFDHPTVATLARHLETLLRQTADLPHPSIQPIPRYNALPLSFAQQRLWFLDRLEGGSPTYNIPYALRLEGHLNTAALADSLAEIGRRHETLRTTFPIINNQPVQLIHATPSVVLEQVEWGGLLPNEQETAVQRWLETAVRQPFNLQQGPLWRAALLHLGETTHIFFLNLHHIIADGWSIGVFYRELAALYEAHRTQYSVTSDSPFASHSSLLAPLPIQYADYAHWQHQQNEALSKQVVYWREKLAHAPTRLELPTDRPRPTVQTFRGSYRTLHLAATLTHTLKTFSQYEGVTLFMTLLAAFNALLHRYTGQEDILIGTPIANRSQAETEPLIGFFVNTLVMRTNLSGNSTFSDLLHQVRETALQAYTHQDLPFEQLVEAIQPTRDLSHSPLFQVMFALQNLPESSFSLPGLQATPISLDSGTSKFDLTLFASEVPEGLRLRLEYNSDLFEGERVERMLGHYEQLLSGIVANPHESISQLPLLTTAETTQLAAWNHTAQLFAPVLAHEWVAQQADKTPSATAVSSPTHTLSYAQLNAQANQLAHFLLAQGVQPNTPVAICLERSVEMAVAVLAVLKAGAAYLPLDPAYPPDRLAFMLADSGASILLTSSPSPFTIHHSPFTIYSLDTLPLAAYPPTNPPTAVSPHHLAYLIYTSGSTGQPKGVAMPHAALANLLAWQQAALPQPAHTLQFAPLSFDVSFQELFSTWGSGGNLFLITEELRRDALALLHFIQQHQIQRLFLPYIALQHLANTAVSHSLFPSSLQDILTAGEQLHITPAISTFFSHLPTCRLHNQYGPSETHVVTAYTLPDDPTTWPAYPPIGRPLPNCTIHLLDPHGHPVPIGIPGELFIGGNQLAHGYLNRPELTAERFKNYESGISNREKGSPFIIPNSSLVIPNSSFVIYKTGDLAVYQPDGHILYLGRIDEQVKIRGFRIEPGEVEQVLSQHSAVHEAAVVAQPGVDGLKQLVAYVVPADAPLPQLRAYLQEKLPAYMIPAVFVPLAALPLTPSGKLNRRALPAPHTHHQNLASTTAPPQTELERDIAQIWQQVLHLDSVGMEDNFFDLGGHSLLLAQVQNHLLQTIAPDIALIDLFKYPTIGALARYLSQPTAKRPILPPPSLIPIETRQQARQQRRQERQQHRIGQPDPVRINP